MYDPPVPRRASRRRDGGLSHPGRRRRHRDAVGRRRNDTLGGDRRTGHGSVSSRERHARTRPDGRQRRSRTADQGGYLRSDTIDPGFNYAELAKAADVTKSTARYHVRVLRDAGLVEITDVAGTIRVSPAEADAELAGILRSESVGSVLTSVAEEEPASVTTLADATGRALSTVSHHLSSLESRGYVDRERTGEAVVTTLTPETRRSIAAFRNAGRSADD